jgi:hypothetical protein
MAALCNEVLLSLTSGVKRLEREVANPPRAQVKKGGAIYPLPHGLVLWLIKHKDKERQRSTLVLICVRG